MVYGARSTLGLESESLSVGAIDVATDAELIRFVENLKKQIRILRLENEILETSIMRLQPSLLAGAFSALECAKKLSLTLLSMDGPSRSRFGMTDSMRSSSNIRSQTRIISHRQLEPSLRSSSVKISRSILGGTGPKINVEERLELVHIVMENIGNELKKYRYTSSKQNDFLKAQLEEIDIRTNYFEKWTQEFEQEVVIEGVEIMTKRIAAETWISFMREQGKKIDRQIDKLRLRTSTANIQHRKLKEDIKRKKDLASRLAPVDFELKTIEIKEALKTIQLQYEHLVALKMMAGDANLNLTIHKYDMMAILNNLKKVQNLKILRESQTVKLNAERVSLEAQVSNLQKSLNWIQEQRMTYLVPDLMKYVKVKLEISELDHSIKRLETSLTIKQCAITNLRRKSMNMSKLILSKKKLKSKKESMKESDLAEVSLSVTQLYALKKVCSPCGLLPWIHK